MTTFGITTSATRESFVIPHNKRIFPDRPLVSDRVSTLASSVFHPFGGGARPVTSERSWLLLREAAAAIRQQHDARIFSAIEEGEERICELLQDPEIQIDSMGHLLMRTACAKGWSRALSLLLEKSMNGAGITPDFFNEQISKASAAGHAAILVQLLALPGVDPRAGENSALIHAANGAVAKLLLEDGRADPNMGAGTCPILMASSCGRKDVVVELLKDSRVNPKIKNSGAVTLAHIRGHHAVVQLLLADSRVNPERKENFIEWSLWQHGLASE